jgi:hypothetical protein
MAAFLHLLTCSKASTAEVGEIMRTIVSGPTWVHYGQIYVQSGDESPDLAECFAGQHNGLCGAAVPGTLFLVTGLHTGSVDFTVEVHEQMPPVEYDAEDVVEAPYRPIGDARLVTWGGDGGWWSLELQPGVDYRARYSAWRMDAGHQAGPPMDGEPLVDRYLLQFWPAQPVPERVVKQTSRQAAYWHKVARDRPTPAELAQQKRERARQAEEHRIAERAAAWGGALPTERLERIRHARELSALDRSLVGALEQSAPDTLRRIARWAVRRACEQAGYVRDARISGVLDRMDAGANWFETLNGPRQPVEPGPSELRGTVHTLVSRMHGWFDDRDPFDNTTTLATATFNDDPLQAAIETVWLSTGPFPDKRQLLTELRSRFFVQSPT